MNETAPPVSGTTAATRAAHEQFLRFLLVGGVSAVVNILSRIALNLAMSFQAAVLVAYLIGMTTAYVLNKLFVFGPSGRAVHEEYFRFTLVNLLSVAQVWIVSVGLAFHVFPAIGFTWHAETIAHTIGVAVPAVTSYFLHRYFSFAAAP